MADNKTDIRSKYKADGLEIDLTFIRTQTTSILKEMGRALYTQAQLSGSDPGAIDWFLDKIEDGLLVLPTPNRIKRNILYDPQRQSSKKFLMLEGRMFAFTYLPINHQTLEYWDATPLVISLGINDGKMMGINLHYLPPPIRADLLNKMLRTATGAKGLKMPPKGAGMFRIDYEDLKTMKFVAGLSCLRSYDLSRIIGRVAMIPSNEWANAAALPYSDFRTGGAGKANEKMIWIETMQNIRELMRRV